MKSKILYVNTGSPELKKAHAIQTFFTCKNLTEFFNISLIYPLTLSLILKRNELKKQYLKNNIRLVLLPTTSFGRIFKSDTFFLFDRFLFSLFVIIYSLLKKSKIIFTRDPLVASSLLFLIKNKKIVLEIHNLEHVVRKNKLNSIIKRIEVYSIKKSDFVVTITEWMLNYVKKINKNTLLVPDALEPSIFRNMNKKRARRILKMDKTKKIVLYSGLTFRYGVSNLIKAGKFLENIEIFIVGGDEEDIKKFKYIAKGEKIKNVFFIPRVPIEKVNLYLNTADVLVLPYSSNEFTEYFTSPLKLFEYMAVKKPIVATRVGCFEGILKNGYNCILVEPGNLESLAKGIKKVIKNKKLAIQIAKNAYIDSKKYTYKKRAKKIKMIIKYLYSSDHK